MNNTTLESFEKYREEKRKEYKLEEKDLIKARKKLANISKDENKSKELIELLKNKNFRDDVESIINLIFEGADVNYKEEIKGDFPLLICARKGYSKVFYTLLRMGANVNLSNNYLTTATMAAARYGNENMLEMLIILGADVNAKCMDGDTALISARRHAQTGCILKLINAQAHINAKNLSNTTVMDICGDLNFKKILIDDVKTNKKKFVTNQDALNLIEEAKEKFNKIKGN